MMAKENLDASSLPSMILAFVLHGLIVECQDIDNDFCAMTSLTLNGFIAVCNRIPQPVFIQEEFISVL